ncbi:hypothetical protein [Plebeiibacterium sediminum]|uniref:Uncharacterized protein n=1 Tax=Plebeiibacterium sediminum TaxID=2992112 RepID=A0AAE3M9E4_9BACT|nr:hypothetical protein [Plebeiobacterium sediminum]MCW3789357.1 hypothetical protein [Plebeiobacterium sediminum]
MYKEKIVFSIAFGIIIFLDASVMRALIIHSASNQLVFKASDGIGFFNALLTLRGLDIILVFGQLLALIGLSTIVINLWKRPTKNA